LIESALFLRRRHPGPLPVGWGSAGDGSAGASPYDAEGRLAGLEVLDAVRRFGDKATMQRVVLEGFAESTSVLREKPDREYGA